MRRTSRRLRTSCSRTVRVPTIGDDTPSLTACQGVRDELKGQNLSFTDIAKLVGERWKVLPPAEKEDYEYQASVAKEKYNNAFEEYKKTDSYKDYAKYLAEFKSKANKENKEVPTGEYDAVEFSVITRSH